MDSIHQGQPTPVILHQYTGTDIPTEIEICFDSSATAITTISSDDDQEKLKDLYESTHIETAEQKLERVLVPKLSSRAYHLPGNDFGQDWKQYVLNNHPILGICFHHRLHPLKTGQRLMMLLGSFAFGVAITNAIYFWFITTGRDSTEEAFAFSFSFQSDATATQSISVSYGLLALLTVGSGSHALFDRFVWSLSACKICRPGGIFESKNRCIQDFGKVIAILIVMLVVCGASMMVVVTALMNKGEEDIDIFHDNNKDRNFEAQDFKFLIGYLMEFTVSLFVMTPLIEFTLFVGVLGCFALPVLGGRPREVAMERRLAKEQQKKAVKEQIDSNVKEIMNSPV
jgi:hypothetical protein